MVYKIFGPYSADTIFLKKNRSKFDVVIGMYHDQVLTPMKTLFEYDAINITLGLPFIQNITRSWTKSKNVRKKFIKSSKSFKCN